MPASGIDFTRAAAREYEEAVRFYNEASHGLGFEFADTVRGGLATICRNPEAWPLLSPTTRRLLLRRFPYGIIYTLRNDRVLVIALMHRSRNPIRWQERIRDDVSS